MYTSNLPIIFLLLLVGHRTISNTLELDTAQDVEKKTIENRTVGKMLALLKNAVRTLLEKCRFTPLKLLKLLSSESPGLLGTNCRWFRPCVVFEVPIL